MFLLFILLFCFVVFFVLFVFVCFCIFLEDGFPGEPGGGAAQNPYKKLPTFMFLMSECSSLFGGYTAAILMFMCLYVCLFNFYVVIFVFQCFLCVFFFACICLLSALFLFFVVFICFYLPVIVFYYIFVLFLVFFV